MPQRQRQLSEADKTLWAKYAREIPPLHGRTGVRHPEPLLAAIEAPANPVGHSARVAASVVGHRAKTPALEVGTQPGGLDSATWQRLRTGKLQAVRKLDLHGMTAQRAFHALTIFLRTAYADHVRCVEVITGRGSGEAGGVIRREFPMWLNLPDIRPLVLSAAHPHPLNPGSVRILLRRHR